MIHLSRLMIEEYDYNLPPEMIAQHPLEQRDASKLLIWNDGKISEDVFGNLPGYLPDKSLLIFNDTRVIKARLLLRKPTGGIIEILCLEPVDRNEEPEQSLTATGSVTWKCLVGNARRWRSGKICLEIAVPGMQVQLCAERINDLEDGCFEIRFTWQPGSMNFGEILNHAGAVPLPPYIQRPSGQEDDIHYQTIYASHSGSVAAPTAGLHFTGYLLETLRKKDIIMAGVTLHVGLGTFRPVNESDVTRHIMHEEKIIASLETVNILIKNLSRPVIAVGTTSVRTIESLYWTGVKLLTNPDAGLQDTDQWDPYQESYDRGIPACTALKALSDRLIRDGLDHYHGSTRLMILPGYRFRIISGMITNFHLPKSTLLLLVSAFAGPNWKKAYEYALNNGFRFLSYGDACLFLKTKI